MSFLIQRAKYRVPAQFNDGVHTVKILSIQDSEEPNIYYFTLLFENGLTLKKHFKLIPDKYGPIDAFFESALPEEEQEFSDLKQLVDRSVDILLMNETVEGRVFTNIKRINKASKPFVQVSPSQNNTDQPNDLEPVDISEIEPIAPLQDIEDLNLDKDDFIDNEEV